MNKILCLDEHQMESFHVLFDIHLGRYLNSLNVSSYIKHFRPHPDIEIGWRRSFYD